MATATATHNIGKVVQVIGPVLDVEFEAEHLPELYNALEINGTAPDGTTIRVIVEVQQHIGRNQVRAVAMSSTDAVVRGMEVVDTGGPITVPVGDAGARPHPQRARRAGGQRRADPEGRAALADSPQAPRLRRTSSRRPKSSRPASRSST